MPLSNVKVNLKWSSSDLITTTCTTNSSGYCSVSKNSSASVSSVTFTVTSAASPSYTYKAVVNHDPEGESTGTIITVFKP
jgi:hypothetical protein